jgi:hypothetical protein
MNPVRGMHTFARSIELTSVSRVMLDVVSCLTTSRVYSDL